MENLKTTNLWAALGLLWLGPAENNSVMISWRYRVWFWQALALLQDDAKAIKRLTLPTSLVKLEAAVQHPACLAGRHLLCCLAGPAHSNQPTPCCFWECLLHTRHKESTLLSN